MANAVQMGRAYVTIGANTGPITRELRNLRATMQRTAAGLGDIGAGATKLGLAISVPLLAAARVGASFEQRMSAVKAVTQSTGEEFKLLQGRAQELGATTSFTAEQVAGGMEALGRAGMRPNEIISSISHNLDLARASGLGMDQVAEIMSDVSRAFNISAKDIGKVGDIITYTANNSNTNIGLLGESFSYVASSAEVAGQSIESVAAALGVLANRGIKGGVAGAQMSMVLSKVSDNAVKARLAQEDLNVAVEDSAGNMRPLVDILGDLRRATSQMGNVEQLGLFGELFGERGKRAALILSGLTTEWRKLESAEKSSGGTSRATAAIMEDNLIGSVNLAISAAEGLATTITQVLTPTYTAWLGKIQQTANALDGIARKNPEIVSGVAQLGAAALATGITFAGMSYALSGMGSALGASVTVAGKAVGAFKALRASLAIASVTDLGLAWRSLGATISGVIPTLTGAGSLLVKAGIAAQAAGGGVAGFGVALKVTAAGAAAAVAPFALLAVTIGALYLAWDKLSQRFANIEAIRVASVETAKLQAQTEGLNRELSALYQTQPLMGDEARNNVSLYVSQMLKAGKTEAEMRDAINKRIKESQQLESVRWTESNALSKANFDSRKKELAIQRSAYEEALKSGLDSYKRTKAEELTVAKEVNAQKLVAEKKLQEDLAAARKEQLTGALDIADQIFAMNEERGKQGREDFQREKFSQKLQDDPTAAYGDALKKRGELKAQLDAAAEAALTAARAAVDKPSAAAYKVAEDALDYYRGVEDQYSIAQDFLRQATSRVVSDAQNDVKAKEEAAAKEKEDLLKKSQQRDTFGTAGTFSGNAATQLASSSVTIMKDQLTVLRSIDKSIQKQSFTLAEWAE